MPFAHQLKKLAGVSSRKGRIFGEQSHLRHPYAELLSTYVRQNLSNKEDYWIGIVNSRENRTLIHDISRTTVKMIIAYRFGAINESCVVIELILPLFYSAILVYVTLTNHVCRLIDHLFLVIPSNCSRNSLILVVLRDRTNNKSNNQRIFRMLNKSYSQEFEIFRN